MATNTEITDRLSSYRWFNINLWFFCGNTASMINFGVGILLPSISADLHLSPSQQGLVGSAAFWSTLILSIPATWVLSRFRAKFLGVAALALAGLFLTIQGGATSFGVLLVGRLGFGLAQLCRMPTQSLLIHQWFRRSEFLLVQGFGSAFWGLLVGGGMLLTPYILSGFDNRWNYVLYTYAAVFGALTVAWVAFGRDRQPKRQVKPSDTKTPDVSLRALANRDLLLMGLGVCGSALTISSFLTFLPTLMLDTYGISLKWSGFAIGIGTITGGVTGTTVGYVASNIGRRNQMLQALGLLMTGTYMGLSLASSEPVLMLLALANGVAWGSWPIVAAVPFSLPGLKSRGIALAVSITTTSFSIGSVVGPIATGFLQEATDLKTALFVMSFGGLMLTMAGTFLRVGRAETPSSETP